jgi:hypothetical protein
MIAIYLNNGDIIVDNFIGFDGDMPSYYTIKSDEHFKDLFRMLRVIKDTQGWYYPVDKIVKFKEVTEEEAKGLRRNKTLTDILNEGI